MKRIFAAALLLLPALSLAATVSFQDGANSYSGQASNYLDSLSPNLNRSDAPLILVGTSSAPEVVRGLIRFDLSSFAGTYSDVSSVTLTLTRFTDFTSRGSNTINLHEVNALNSDWSADTSTWNTKDGTNAWDGGAGLGATGYDGTLASQAWIPTTDTLTFTITGLAAKSLIDDFTTGNNGGFLLNSTDETPAGNNFIYLNDESAGLLAPQLSITYTPAPEPSAGFLILASLGVVSQRRVRRK